jgi:hypothetical protein
MSTQAFSKDVEEEAVRDGFDRAATDAHPAPMTK